MYFNEPPCANNGARHGSIIPCRRNQRSDGLHAGIIEQAGHFRHAANIFATGYGAKTEVGGEPIANFIAIKHTHRQLLLAQPHGERIG